jgi:excisionase family DNA binding protein
MDMQIRFMSIKPERKGEMQTEELIGVAELAKRLNVPVSWIYQRTRLGPKAIPHVKMGKYVRFNLAEVVEFFRNHPPLERD